MTVLCLMVFVGLAPEQAAAVKIDGKFDGKYDALLNPSGYTHKFTTDFKVEGLSDLFSGGQLWLNEGSGYVDFAFLLPRELVDNTIGGNLHSSWPRGHTFRSLLGSDDARFIIPDTLDVTVDYLKGFGANTSTTAGGSKKHKGGSKKGKGGKGGGPPFRSGGVTEGDASAIFAVETSMGFNYAMYGGSHPGLFGRGSSSPQLKSPDLYETFDPALNGWVFDVTYELRIAASALGTGFDIKNPDLQIELVHASPNKIGKNKTYFFLNTPTGVPVPSTLLLTSLGLLGLGAWRRRLRRRN